MGATDVSDTLQAALQASGLDQVKVLHRPRLFHPMTQGKIGRHHRSMKNKDPAGKLTSAEDRPYSNGEKPSNKTPAPAGNRSLKLQTR